MRRILVMPILGLGVWLCCGPSRAEDCLERVGRAPHGIARAVVAHGTLSFLGNGAELTVLSLVDPSSPEVTATLDLPFYIWSLAIDADRLYAATTHHIHVIDVANPASPAEIGRVERFSAKQEMSASGDLLCIIEDSSRVLVVDVGDPANPVVVSWWSQSAPSDVEVVGDHAFTTAFGGLGVWDLTDPSTPTEVGSLAGVGGHLAAAGNLLYAATTGAFKIIDITTLSNPAVVGQSASIGGIDVAVAGDLAFLLGNGVLVVDVSNPASPTWTGTAPWPYDSMASVAAVPEYAITATYDRGFRVIDATLATSPFETAAIEAPGISTALAYSNGFVVLASNRRGLRIVDVSDSSAPKESTVFDLGWTVVGVDVQTDLAYAVGSTLAVVDISDPASPLLLGEPDPWAFSGFDIEVVGTTAYVAALSRGLVVVDVADPALPVEIGSLDFGDGEFEHIDVLGDVAVLRGPTIEIVDLSLPSHPTSLSTLDLSVGVNGGVGLMGRWLLVPAFDALHVFDLVDPTNPVEVAVHSEPRTILSMGVAGTMVYLGPYAYENLSEIQAWDMGDPLNPVLIATHGEAGDVMGFAFSEEHIYTSRRASGVDVFTACRGPIFADGFESGDTTVWSSTVP